MAKGTITKEKTNEKKKIYFGSLILVLLFCLTGCIEIVSETPINVEYVASYSSMETVYEYRYDWLHGDFKYLPVLKTVHHDEVYKVEYERLYSDNTTFNYWKNVSKEEYTKAAEHIGQALD